MKDQHTVERQRLDDNQKTRAQSEARLRASRLRHGVMGLWDRITGQHGLTSKQNEAEAFAAYRRDRGQRDDLIADQLKERRTLQREIVAVRHRHAGRIDELHGDLSRQSRSHEPERDTSRNAFNDAASGKASPTRSERPRHILRGRTNERSGPDFGR